MRKTIFILIFILSTLYSDNYGVYFNGNNANDFIEFIDHEQIFEENMTLEVSFTTYPDKPTGGHHSLILKQRSGGVDPSFHFFITNENNSGGYVGYQINAASNCYDFEEVITDVWVSVDEGHHLVVSFDGFSDNTIYIYLDGGLEYSGYCLGTIWR